MEKINEEVKKVNKPTKQEPVDDSVNVIDIKARESDLIEKKRIDDETPVRGVFKFFEIQGGNLEFSFMNYKRNKNKRYNLRDGESYILPKGVARHLNTSGWWPKHEHSIDAEGRPLQIIGSKIRRYAFYPIDFVDVGQYDNEDKKILQVNQL